MNNSIKLVFSFLLLTFVAACTPLSQTPQTEINSMSSKEICSTGNASDELSLAEKIVNARGTSCDGAKAMCYEAGLKPTSKEWANCYIQAKGVIAQQDAADAAREASRAAMMSNMQRNIDAARPRGCYSANNTVTCY